MCMSALLTNLLPVSSAQSTTCGWLLICLVGISLAGVWVSMGPRALREIFKAVSALCKKLCRRCRRRQRGRQRFSKERRAQSKSMGRRTRGHSGVKDKNVSRNGSKSERRVHERVKRRPRQNRDEAATRVDGERNTTNEPALDHRSRLNTDEGEDDDQPRMRGEAERRLKRRAARRTAEAARKRRLALILEESGAVQLQAPDGKELSFSKC